jgi:hypothetical protein
MAFYLLLNETKKGDYKTICGSFSGCKTLKEARAYFKKQVGYLVPPKGTIVIARIPYKRETWWVR